MNRKLFSSSKLALLIALGAAGANASAQTYWDAVGNFSTTSNQSNNWSYMYRQTNGVPTLMPYSQANCRGLTGLSCWNLDAGTFDLPMVGINTKGSVIDFGSGGIPLSTLSLHPGANGEQAIVRFTAPAAGTYQFLGHFQMVDKSPTGVSASINLNGSSTYPIYSWLLSSFGAAAPFSFQRAMSIGQTLDFVVDANGNYANDTTELKVGVVKVN